jgi:hypothetical protein
VKIQCPDCVKYWDTYLYIQLIWFIELLNSTLNLNAENYVNLEQNSTHLHHGKWYKDSHSLRVHHDGNGKEE